MSISESLLHVLLQDLPQQKTQIYFKPALTALSHAIEDLVLAADDPGPLVIACFQQERFYQQEMRRYQQIAARTDQVYVLAAPEAESGFAIADSPHFVLPLSSEDGLAQEWHLIVLGQDYAACLICRERQQDSPAEELEMSRRFEGFWTFERRVCRQAAQRLLERILLYRPELLPAVGVAHERYGLSPEVGYGEGVATQDQQSQEQHRPDVFAQRLVNYLQASQHKLLKIYQSSAALERIQRNLIAIVGHELRTPLSSIQVVLESLEEEPEMPPDYRAMMLETALVESDRMKCLVQDFLTLSRLQSGQIYRESETLQLREVLELALSGLRHRLVQMPDLAVKIDFPAQLPNIRADGEGLVEIFSKLLDNACKFTAPAGQITIQAQPFEQPLDRGLEDATAEGSAERGTDRSTIHSANHSAYPERPLLEVIISDTGRGIEPSQLKAIFNAFYQEEGFLQRTVGGSGLGLSICRCIVEGMGGDLWAYSAGKGLGSQFHFTVPIETVS